jgi:hypothetical protein
MTEIKDCLPESAWKHFIDLRNIRHAAKADRYRERLVKLRTQIGARNQGRSGWQEMEEWKYKEELWDSLAKGYVEDAFETCRLYDIELTRPLCDCLVKATSDLLETQYGHALQAHAQGGADVKVPLAMRQQGSSLRIRKIMPQIRVMIEAARVEDVKKRVAMAKEKERSGATYNQTITQHGGVMNASQTGNVSAQQLTVGQLDDLRPALAQMRAFFKKQEDSVDADEYAGLLASAEKAAQRTNAEPVNGSLRGQPGRVAVPVTEGRGRASHHCCKAVQRSSQPSRPTWRTGAVLRTSHVWYGGV